MGNVTSDLLIWTPDENDTAEPDIYLATMSQSLEDGVGVRLRKQEQTQSAVANLAISQTFVNGTAQTISYTFNSIGYNDGMTLAGGKYQITVEGLYYFSFNAFVLSSSSTSSGSAKLNIRKNGATIGSGLALISQNGSTASGVCASSVVSKCNVGDLIDVYCLFAGATTGTLSVSAASPEYNMFSAALLKAL